VCRAIIGVYMGGDVCVCVCVGGGGGMVWCGGGGVCVLTAPETDSPPSRQSALQTALHSFVCGVFHLLSGPAHLGPEAVSTITVIEDCLGRAGGSGSASASASASAGSAEPALQWRVRVDRTTNADAVRAALLCADTAASRMYGAPRFR
jgi:hypothetical protein